MPPSFAKFRPCHAPRMTDRLLPDRPFPPLHHILFRFPCLQSAIVSLHSFRSKLVEWKSSSIYVMESKEETRDGVSFVERREEFTSIIFSNRKKIIIRFAVERKRGNGDRDFLFDSKRISLEIISVIAYRESFWYSIEVDCSSLNENDGRRSASGTHLLDKWARAPTYNSLSHAILNLTYRSGAGVERGYSIAPFFPILPRKTRKNPSSLPTDSFFPFSLVFANDSKLVGEK